jgi:mannose-1-phosphate guanylyltransferase
MKIVIRAGGVGTRLWPKSRKNEPKQFLKLLGEKSLLRETVDRVLPMVNAERDLFISSTFNFSGRILEEIGDIKPEHLITEPSSRNTGPAICLECAFLEKLIDKDEIVATLPSDDFISDPGAFCDLLGQAEKFLKQNPDYILTPAVLPNEIDTGYSYLKEGKNLQQDGEEAIFEVVDWVEKPNYDFCKELIDSGVYYYHTGMYIWQLGNVLALWEKHNPKMLKVCREIVAKGLDSQEAVGEMYNILEKCSVESALADRVEKIAMSVSNRIGWSDLGKWSKIKKYLTVDGDGNVTQGNVVPIDTTDCMILSSDKKIIATVGLDDMIVIDTPDALLICPEKRVEDIKKVIEKLKENNKDDYL